MVIVCNEVFTDDQYEVGIQFLGLKIDVNQVW
jgi:hypothetical protein